MTSLDEIAGARLCAYAYRWPRRRCGTRPSCTCSTTRAAGTIRQWRFRDDLKGGPGWVDGEDMLDFLDNPERRPGAAARAARRREVAHRWPEP